MAESCITVREFLDFPVYNDTNILKNKNIKMKKNQQ